MARSSDCKKAACPRGGKTATREGEGSMGQTEVDGEDLRNKRGADGEERGGGRDFGDADKGERKQKRTRSEGTERRVGFRAG